MAELRRIGFELPLTAPVGDVTDRSGWLIEGPEGWGESSPLPSWNDEERTASEKSAIEAATKPYPPPTRQSIEVNSMVPRVPPAIAVRIAQAAGCSTVKIKVGDDQDEARVRAVVEAMPNVRIRLDANGSWDVEAARQNLARFADLPIEYVEDPVATLDELAELRQVTTVPLAAESCIRTIADARRFRELDAADVVVIKPQRIGGAQAALDAIAEANAPGVMSSALESSVGLATVLAAAAALDESATFGAHGIGTAMLLQSDVTDDPLVPIGGSIEVRRVAPSEAWLLGASSP
jgi:O-succinylbenzoate synthase